MITVKRGLGYTTGKSYTKMHIWRILLDGCKTSIIKKFKKEVTDMWFWRTSMIRTIWIEKKKTTLSSRKLEKKELLFIHNEKRSETCWLSAKKQRIYN